MATLPDGTGVVVSSSGKGLTAAAKQATCFGELAERMAVLEAAPHVYASYQQLGKDAMPPVDMILDHPSCVGRGVTPYNPGTKVGWALAQSLRTQKKSYVLRPARSDRRRFFKHTTSGCSAGPDKEYAIANAIFELVERDAFVTSWYARRPPYAQQLFSSNEPIAQWLAAHGFHCRCYDITAGTGIPVSLVMALQEGKGKLVPGAAVFACAASHVPAGAQRKALLEVAQTVEYYNYVKKQKHWLNHFDNHVRYYLSANRRQARAYLDHALRMPASLARNQERFGKEYERSKTDALVNSLHRLKLEPWIIERAPVFIGKKKYEIVEAVVPGLQPLTLETGTKNRRLHSALFRQMMQQGRPISKYPHPL